MDESLREFARQVIATEAGAVRAMEGAIDEDFARACALIVGCPSSVLTTGIGKAGHIARKVSADLRQHRHAQPFPLADRRRARRSRAVRRGRRHSHLLIQRGER
jgi:hypothetical protein